MSRSAGGRYRSIRAVTLGLIGIALLSVAVALGIAGLRSDAGEGQQASARAANRAESHVPVGGVTEDKVEAFRNALWTTPFIATSDRVELSFADREGSSAALIEGTILAAAVGPDHLVVEDLVRCEGKDGVPTGGQCVQRLSVKMVTFTIEVNDARMLPKSDGPPVTAGQQITLELLVGATDNGSPAAADAAQAIVDSTPVGSRVASFAFQNPAGNLQQAGPDAWALVDPAGGFISLSEGGAYSGRGFLGLQEVSDLGF